MFRTIWTLFVSDGRVACPLRGDSDIDRCAGCPWLRTFDARGAIRCAAPSAADPWRQLPLLFRS